MKAAVEVGMGPYSHLVLLQLFHFYLLLCGHISLSLAPVSYLENSKYLIFSRKRDFKVSLILLLLFCIIISQRSSMMLISKYCYCIFKYIINISLEDFIKHSWGHRHSQQYKVIILGGFLSIFSQFNSES